MLMNNELVKIEVAIDELKNLKEEGRKIRAVRPVQETQAQYKDQHADDLRIDYTDKEGQYDIDNSIYFRRTTKKTQKQLENECDEVINEEFY